MVDLAAWLAGLGLSRYEQAFRDNDIDADLLPSLTVDDLRELGIGSLGHRKRLLAAIAAMAEPPAVSATAPHVERRRLTVMFVDLVGSTALSGRLDPEDMREVLHRYQNTVTCEIARVNGHVAKLMGDGVLAYFGWPRAEEDEAERAVQAGLAIVQAVARLPAPANGGPLAARVGIATGLVVVGDLVEAGAAHEEQVVGETPNLSARLQEAAPPGAVVIADGTRRLLGQQFELRDLGRRCLKGFSHPVACFQVVGQRPAGSRFEARQTGEPLPMVGRDQELALLLERWRQAAIGEGQAVLLVGEAGIGKSRLVRAVLDALVEEEHTALRYQCSPHHGGTALWPIAQQIGHAAGLEPDDPEPVKVEKLTALLRQGTDDVEAALPLIAALLGVDAGETCRPLTGLTPPQRRARTLAVLTEQLLGLARRRPVLMVLEDAHWADPTTLELVGATLDRIASARALLLLTSRPDNQPSLGGHPHVTRLTLNRLGRGPTEAIVAWLAQARRLPSALLREIAARTDGVPLFVEELTKAVLEAGASEGAVPVPASLHASLMARLDRVPGAMEVAQAAACIGREFSYPLLAVIWRSAEPELRAALDRLAAAELIFARGLPSEASYTFKHALVRDAAHESLLKADRQRLHGSIAQALEERFPSQAREAPELLAEHCAEAGLMEKAVDHWRRAGQQALARSAIAEATTHLAKGLEALSSLPHGPERQRRELALQLAVGQASIAGRGFAAPETGRAYARAHELCRELGEVRELFPVLYGRSVFHFQRGELAAAHELAQELARTAEESRDASALVTGHRMLGSATSQLGRLIASREHFETALSLYEPERDRGSAFVYAIDSRVMCLSWLSHVLTLLGDPEQGAERDREAAAFARDIAHPNTTAVALVWSCIFHQLRGDRAGARRRSEAVAALAAEQGFPLYAAAGTVVRGWALARDEPSTAIEAIRAGLAAYEATGARMWTPYFLGLLAQALGATGNVAQGLGAANEALAWVQRTGARWIEAELHRLRGELLLESRDAAQAEGCFLYSLAVARERRAALWERRAATSLAKLRPPSGKTNVTVRPGSRCNR